jgi:molybdate transport system regulatory protein
VNRIPAVVTAVESLDTITIVSFEALGTPMRMMALEMPETVEIGSRVMLGVKASGVILAKAFSGTLSISNRLDATVESVKNGSLVSSITVRFGEVRMESIVTRESSERMGLQPGDGVTALIKASELSVLELL